MWCKPCPCVANCREHWTKWESADEKFRRTWGTQIEVLLFRNIGNSVQFGYNELSPDKLSWQRHALTQCTIWCSTRPTHINLLQANTVYSVYLALAMLSPNDEPSLYRPRSQSWPSFVDTSRSTCTRNKDTWCHMFTKKLDVNLVNSKHHYIINLPSNFTTNFHNIKDRSQ